MYHAATSNLSCVSVDAAEAPPAEEAPKAPEPAFVDDRDKPEPQVPAYKFSLLVGMFAGETQLSRAIAWG